MKKIAAFCALPLLLLMAVCSGTSSNADKPGSGVSAPGTQFEGVDSLCDDYAVIVDGIYKYENNTWGADSSLPYQQCLITKDENGTQKKGWTWSFRGKAPNWVFSYPEIIVGWKPWGETTPTDPAYPAQISQIAELKIDYDIELSAEGGYNVAPEIWLISEKPALIPMEKPERLITTEIMFWMDYSGMVPAGSKVGTIELDGKTYDLWAKQDHSNSGDTVSWSIFSLVSHDKQLKGSIDVIGLINKLAENGYSINTAEYVATVEFGTETAGPSSSSSTRGTVWINDYSVTIRMK